MKILQNMQKRNDFKKKQKQDSTLFQWSLVEKLFNL